MPGLRKSHIVPARQIDMECWQRWDSNELTRRWQAVSVHHIVVLLALLFVVPLQCRAARQLLSNDASAVALSPGASHDNTEV